MRVCAGTRARACIHPREVVLVFAMSTSETSGLCGQTLRLLEEGGDKEGLQPQSNSFDDVRILKP